MLEVIIAACGGAAVSGVFMLIKDALNRRAAEKDCEENEAADVRDGLQILLYDRIKYLCKTYLKQDYINAEDLEDLIRMHKVYHDKLNGNGFLDDLMDAVHKLPKR